MIWFYFQKYSVPEDWPYVEARRLFKEPEVKPSGEVDVRNYCIYIALRELKITSPHYPSYNLLHHSIKIVFYIVNFFLFFLNKSHKDPTFGLYNLAHSDVTVFQSFKPKVAKTFMNFQWVMLHQPWRQIVVFSQKTEQFFKRSSIAW